MCNLLETMWLPVIRVTGDYSRESLISVLRDAGHIRDIAPNNPMDRIAILRFLTAVLYWGLGIPPEAGLPSNTPLPEKLFKKLEDNRDCFNLLGDGKRFYQDPSCKNLKPNQYKSVSYLIHEVPTGTNHSHFKHAIDKRDGLCVYCVILGLLRLPAFSTKGGRGLSPGLNGKPPVYLMPQGSTLLETIYAMWRGREGCLGFPAWENLTQELPAKVPLLTGLTWLPRKIWLGAIDSTGRCISCGSSAEIIKTSAYQGAGALPRECEWRDPNTITYKDKDNKDIGISAKDLRQAGQFKSDKACSRDLMLLLNEDMNGVLWNLVGFASSDATLVDAWESQLDLRDLRLSKYALSRFDEWNKGVVNLSHKEKQGNSEDKKRGENSTKTLINAFRFDIEHRVSENRKGMMQCDEQAWQTAAAAYTPAMEAVARALYPGHTVADLESRDRLARARPNVQVEQKNHRGGIQ